MTELKKKEIAKLFDQTFFFIFCVGLLILDDSEERTRVTDIKCINTVGKRDERRPYSRWLCTVMLLYYALGERTG